jgi:hypothetical protein
MLDESETITSVIAVDHEADADRRQDSGLPIRRTEDPMHPPGTSFA